MGFRDEWPTLADGSDFDGRGLSGLLQRGSDPFQKEWDVSLLIEEIESNTRSKVIDIPMVYDGANNYGFHFKLQNYSDILARVARGDVNMPDYDGLSLEEQVSEIKFEAATYKLLQSEPGAIAPRLLYYRVPKSTEGPHIDRPTDIRGRRLMIFELEKGKANVWRELDAQQKAGLLAQAADVRAALFNLRLPLAFAQRWFLERLFQQKPSSLPFPVAPTRDFCVELFTAKINATIRNVGDMIGWESDHATVGTVAAGAKLSLLRLIPHILPEGGDHDKLYRLVLEHGDFGIHNMTITVDPGSDKPLVTSLYDWETGCITPAILSDPQMSVIIDLSADINANPVVSRVKADLTTEQRETYSSWARQYIKALFKRAPDYEQAIKAGKDARHLWFALRDWRGQDPEGYFGALGAWAENRMRELGVE